MTATSYPLVLFDLDGTLVDTAPDLHAALTAMQHERGVAGTAPEAFREVVSLGGRAMLALGFPGLDEEAREALLPEFLERYGRAVARLSRPFDGIPEVLARIEAGGARWGIVTNKPEMLARALVEALGWASRCAVLVGGDTLAQRKPAPEPLLEACRRLDVAPTQALYVGDDHRDVLAARAAAMPVLAAAWGYRLADDDIVLWQADAVVDSPRGLLARLTGLQST